MWNCPYCRRNLSGGAEASALRCEGGHTFDRAREGYVNLLPPNRKGSRQPGDNAAMVAARRRIHESDIYRPLLNAVLEALPAKAKAGTVLDLGCGEGYYTQALAEAFPDAQIKGIDISRSAIKLAAKKCKSADFAVASNFDIPLSDNATIAALRIFSPADDGELRRVLCDSGLYLEVSPGPRHLWQLREALYDIPREHGPARSLIDGMQLKSSEVVQFQLELDRTLLVDLIGMTPFAHRASKLRRDAAIAGGLAVLEMDFVLRLFESSS